MSEPLLEAALAALAHPSSAPLARFERPAADEYFPYYGKYIDRVPAGDLLATMRAQATEVAAFFGPLSPVQAAHAYAPGKWTVKEVLGHLIDTERVFAHRALWFARRDPAPLPGYDQDAWAAPAGFGSRALADVLAEWMAVRAASVTLAAGLPADAPERRGIASEREFSVRALLYVLPGHTVHHLEQLRERYVGGPGWPA